jgi:hypothetical protein
LAFVTFGGLFFLNSGPPSTLRGHNFFNSIPFLMIFSAPNVLIGGVQILFKHQENWSLPLGFGLF